MKPFNQEQNLLNSKQHFEILDGLRGFAAVVVLVFHFMEIIIPDLTKNFIAHGYLAVDFFFCLSGFVIAYAYDSRIRQIGLWPFIKLRLIRLHPLVVIGAIIGLLAFVFDPFIRLVDQFSFRQNVGLLLSACLMVPYPIVPERYFNNFHLNPPTWSLFWEYIFNILYALVLFRLRHKMLWALTFIAGLTLCYTVMHFGHLSVGWAGDNIWGGGARIFYSFLAGMLIFRSGWIIKSNIGFRTMVLLLGLAFIVPFAEKANLYTEPLIVILYFPFLIALGAGAQLAPADRPVCVLSGKLSYPLYMVHYPFIWLFFSYLERYPSTSVQEMVWIMVVGVVLLVGLAYLVMKYLDEPIRKYLKGHMKREWGKEHAVK